MILVYLFGVLLTTINLWGEELGEANEGLGDYKGVGCYSQFGVYGLKMGNCWKMLTIQSQFFHIEDTYYESVAYAQ